MNNLSFEQLLFEATKAQLPEEKDSERIAYARTKEFEVSDTFNKHKDELISLIKPLLETYPNEYEYELYAQAHDGLAEGEGMSPGKRSKHDNFEKRLYVKNPAYVFLTEAKRSKANGGDCFPNLSDHEYQSMLNSVESLSEWWERKSSANAFELAKSAIVQTVLFHDDLRSKVFERVAIDIAALSLENQLIENWRESL